MALALTAASRTAGGQPYKPINFPRISFKIGERGTPGHAGSSDSKDAPQMSLFEDAEMTRK
jgi:hypothetical protein